MDQSNRKRHWSISHDWRGEAEEEIVVSPNKIVRQDPETECTCCALLHCKYSCNTAKPDQLLFQNLISLLSSAEKSNHFVRYKLNISVGTEQFTQVLKLRHKSAKNCIGRQLTRFRNRSSKLKSWHSLRSVFELKYYLQVRTTMKKLLRFIESSNK